MGCPDFAHLVKSAEVKQTNFDELLANLKTGNRVQQEEILSNPSLNKVIQAFVNKKSHFDPTTIESIANEVLATLWLNSDSYQSRDHKSALGYIRKIAMTKIINFNRKRNASLGSNGRMLLFSEADNDKGLFGIIPDRKHLGPDNEIEIERELELLRLVLRTPFLPPNQVRAISERLRGAEQSETAETFGLSLGTVKSQARMAIEKLRLFWQASADKKIRLLQEAGASEEDIGSVRRHLGLPEVQTVKNEPTPDSATVHQTIRKDPPAAPKAAEPRAPERDGNFAKLTREEKIAMLHADHHRVPSIAKALSIPEHKVRAIVDRQTINQLMKEKRVKPVPEKEKILSVSQFEWILRNAGIADRQIMRALHVLHIHKEEVAKDYGVEAPAVDLRASKWRKLIAQTFGFGELKESSDKLRVISDADYQTYFREKLDPRFETDRQIHRQEMAAAALTRENEVERPELRSRLALLHQRQMENEAEFPQKQYTFRTTEFKALIDMQFSAGDPIRDYLHWLFIEGLPVLELAVRARYHESKMHRIIRKALAKLGKDQLGIDELKVAQVYVVNDLTRAFFTPPKPPAFVSVSQEQFDRAISGIQNDSARLVLRMRLVNRFSQSDISALTGKSTIAISNLLWTYFPQLASALGQPGLIRRNFGFQRGTTYLGDE